MSPLWYWNAESEEEAEEVEGASAKWKEEKH